MALGALRLQDRPLVPLELQPAQGVEDLLDVLGRRAFTVGIFDAQEERAAGPARQQPVVERGPRAADVQRAGRGRSEAKPHGGAAAMLVGAHVSPAGGPARAIERGTERGARAIQFFNQNPRAWRAREYTDEEAAAFAEARKGSDVDSVLFHAVYLINCASEDGEIRQKSLGSLTIALRSGDALGIDGVVLHAGSALGGDVHAAVDRAGAVIAEALAESAHCPLHLENTAGAGGALGPSFHELAGLIAAAGADPRLRLCLDSCHLHASGFDVRTAEGLTKV